MNSKQGRRQQIYQGGQRKKSRKLAKKNPKIALFSLFQGGRGQRKKRPKNSTFESLSIIFVPCLKIQGGHGPSAPLAADAHDSK